MNLVEKHIPSPSAEEMTTLTRFAQQHGLASTCRLIFNMNEFCFVD